MKTALIVAADARRLKILEVIAKEQSLLAGLLHFPNRLRDEVQHMLKVLMVTASDGAGPREVSIPGSP